MATISAIKLSAFVLLLAICVAHQQAVEAVVRCTDVEANLNPCVPLLKSAGTPGQAPSRSCCAVIQNIQSSGRAIEDRRAICQCLKTYAASTQGFNYGVAASLPKECGVTPSYTLSPSTDCSKIGG